MIWVNRMRPLSAIKMPAKPRACDAAFGMMSFLGVGATTVFTGLLLVGLVMLLGTLARNAFMMKFREFLKVILSKYLPGYSSYRLSAKEKLQSTLRMLPYASALIKQQEYWRQPYVIERGRDDYCVVFLPDVPETGRGEVLIAKSDQIRLLPAVSANDLDASLRRIGKGLLSALQLRELAPVVSRFEQPRPHRTALWPIARQR